MLSSSLAVGCDHAARVSAKAARARALTLAQAPPGQADGVVRRGHAPRDDRPRPIGALWLAATMDLPAQAAAPSLHPDRAYPSRTDATPAPVIRRSASASVRNT